MAVDAEVARAAVLGEGARGSESDRSCRQNREQNDLHVPLPPDAAARAPAHERSKARTSITLFRPRLLANRPIDTGSAPGGPAQPGLGCLPLDERPRRLPVRGGHPQLLGDCA